MRVGRLLYDTAADGTGGTGATTTDTKDAAYWEREARSAFKARDEIKNRLRDVETRALSDDDRALFETLKAERAAADEDKKRKAGEWDTLRTQLVEKHTKDLAERDTKLTTLSQRFQRSVVLAEFGRATDYFGGGEHSKTIFDAQLGMDVLGRYVSVEDADTDEGYRIVVKLPSGERILGADGNPAPFAEAIGELIKRLPNKDRILRGSGKTGSGSSGGTTKGNPFEHVDFSNLTPEQRKDPNVLKALRERRPRGGMVVGEAYQR